MFLLMDIGCIECGSGSGIVGVFSGAEMAGDIARKLDQSHEFHDGGQHRFNVYEIPTALNVVQEYYTNPIEE